jgi:hypothetical protein
MINKIVEEQKTHLLSKLSPEQREYLGAIDWLYNGPRRVGRTHLICTVALLSVLNGGDGYVFDHSPSYPNIKSYVKSLLLKLADDIHLNVRVREVPNGFVISRVPEWIEYEKK